MNALQSYSLLLSLLVAGFGANGTPAQSYPGKVVRIVTAPASSSSDFISRVVAAARTRQA